eukprot:2994672-Prorocentrum_lima.AAC.1
MLLQTLRFSHLGVRNSFSSYWHMEACHPAQPFLLLGFISDLRPMMVFCPLAGGLKYFFTSWKPGSGTGPSGNLKLILESWKR